MAVPVIAIVGWGTDNTRIPLLALVIMGIMMRIMMGIMVRIMMKIMVGIMMLMRMTMFMKMMLLMIIIAIVGCRTDKNRILLMIIYNYDH